MLLSTITLSILSSLYILPRIVGFIANNNKTIKNYRNNTVYNCGGLYLSINMLLICTLILFFDRVSLRDKTNTNIIILIIGILSASLTGYIDDNSNDGVKGIHGHYKSLKNNTLTSGIIKAFMGILTSLVICIICGYEKYNFFINFFIIPLSQNFINLMDLRPARAVKTYIGFSLIITPFIIINSHLYILISSVISLLFFLPYELNEILILGDTGANLLGIILGIIITSIKKTGIRIIILIFLICVQIYAERRSINLLIERNYILKHIDMLGRRKYNDDKDKESSS